MSMKRTPADPHSVVERLKRDFEEIVHRSRLDIEKTDDPRVKVILETAAEVLTGLKTVCEHFQTETEAAFHA